MRLDPLPQEHSPALADEFASFHKTLGFVPNSVLTMQRKPELVRAFVAMQRAIWDPGSKVDRGFKRLVAHVASRAAGDAYGMAHTASGALHFGIDADKLAAARDYRASPLYNAAEKAALDLAVAALASEASGQRGNSFEVRAHSASEDARKRAGDTRPEPGSSARAASAVPSAVTNELFDELRRHWSRSRSSNSWRRSRWPAFSRAGTRRRRRSRRSRWRSVRKHLAAQGWSPGASEITERQIMIRTPVCDLLDIEHPIALGGMGSVYSPELVAGVERGRARCHGLPLHESGQIRAGTAAIRERTNKGFGLNFLLFDVKEEGAAALDLRPAVMAFAWPRPEQKLEPFIARAHDAGCKVTFMAGGVPEAVRAAEAGADVIIAQGTEGGGHVGWQGSLALVPMVVDAVAPIPVLAAGGIADGRGLAAALALGADGVLLGTRFSPAGIAAASQFQAGDRGQRRPRHAAVGDSRPRGRDRLAGRDVALAAQPLHRALGRAGMGLASGSGGGARRRAGRPQERQRRGSRAIDGAGRRLDRHSARGRDRRPNRPGRRAHLARATAALVRH